MSRRFLRAIVFHSATIATVTLLAFWWAQAVSPAAATTVAFMTLALAQLFHLGTARAHVPVLSPRRMVANRWALAAVALVLGLQAVAVTSPALREVLHTTSLTWSEWWAVLAASSVPALIGQGLRLRRSRRTR